MGKRTALLVVLISVVVVGLFTTSQAFIASNVHMCPHSFANDTQDAFGLSNRSAVVQLGLTHQIPCLAYSQREDESPFMVWYKLNESTDIGERLVSYNRKEYAGDHGPRYSLAYDFGLLIKDVEESDGGKYLCEVKWRDMEYIKQEETINIQVIGHTFPHGGEAVSEGSPPSRLEQGRRHTLPCGCASQTPDTWDSVVYWSTGEGVTTDTQIIGARFSDGTTLQIQHGADYSIGSDASLTVNSLNDVQDTQRFWCHVFQSDVALHSCSTDVQIQDGNPSFVLTASPTEFYLPEGFPQVLPCRSWTPGDVMCDVRWIHEHDESSQRVVLSYNLSTDTVEADSDYDLASDFGLGIKLVKPTHAGRYTCYIEDGSGKAPLTEALDTHVIGDSFPASPYTGSMSSSVTVMQGQGMTLLCECAQQSADASILAVYWSKGEGKNSETDVIAARLANGSLLNSKNNGFSISSDWSLSMNSLNDSSSFCCHAFRSDDTLFKCHTDVWIMQDMAEAEESKGSNASSAYWWLLALVIVIPVVLLCLWYRREWSSTSSCKMGEWLESDKKTYKDPELFHITPQGRERLNVGDHSDFFIGSTDGNGRVLQGRSGSGKTNFLKKLRHDLQIIKPICFLFRPKIVVLTKAQKICDAVRNIKLHISYILHLSDAVILVDDCNGVKDIEEVLKATKDLSRCQLVMTTRSKKLARVMSKEYGLRHVTITGFSESNAQEYVKSKLEDDCKHNNKDTRLDEGVCVPLRYLNSHILLESVACLPGFLKRLCECPDLKPHSSVNDVVTGILKYMFYTSIKNNLADKIGNADALTPRTQKDVTGLLKYIKNSDEIGYADGLTQKVNELLPKFGKIVLSGMLDHSQNEEWMSKKNILQSCTDRNNVLKYGIDMGLLCDEKESNTENSFKEESIAEEPNRQQERSNGEVSLSSPQVSNIDMSTGEMSCPQEVTLDNVTRIECGPQKSNIEKSSGEWSGAQASNIEKSTGDGFGRHVSNIENSNGERFGRQASNIENSTGEGPGPILRQCSSDITINKLEKSFCPQESKLSNSNTEAFISPQEFDLENCSSAEACSSQEFDIENSNVEAPSPQEIDIENSNVEAPSPHEFDIENSAKDESSPVSPLLTITDLDSKVRFSLEIFRDFCAGKHLAQNPQEWMEKINVINTEQLVNIVVFATSQNYDVARTFVQHFIEIGEQKGSGSLEDLFQRQRLTKLCLEVNFRRPEGPLDNEINSILRQGQLRFVGVSSHILGLMVNCLKHTPKNKYTLKLRSVELFRIDENLSCAEFTQYVKYLCPSQKNTSVFQALQEELIDTQSGECHLSTSAEEFARYLPKQQHLEKIVLLGSVLGSQQICNLIHNLDRPKNLKQLDLRLNTQIDGRAFVEIMTQLSACTELIDLRLSLYKVTTEEFEEVKVYMTNDATLLRRLQTLYLLHGRLSQSFGKFLTDIIGYMDKLQCFHVSALVESDYEQGIPDEVVEEIRRQKADRTELIVDNTDALRAKLGEPQLTEGATTSTTSSQDSLVVDMMTTQV